jgi:hypothetical protein
MSRDWTLALSVCAVIAGLASTYFFDKASKPMPFELQTWDNNTAPEVEFRAKAQSNRRIAYGSALVVLGCSVAIAFGAYLAPH